MGQLLQTFSLSASVRIICGLFFIPHIWVKFFNRAGPVNFFRAAGLPTAAWWVLSLAVLELIFAVGLIWGLYTSYVAWLAAIYLLVAAYYTWQVSKHEWFWAVGGPEYTVFWALICVALALGH